MSLGLGAISSGASALKRGNGSADQFSSWQKRVRISIKNTSVPGALTDFPVLIDETVLPADIWAIALDGGGDLRFSSDSQGVTHLNLEVVGFDTTAETAELHVKVPSVSASVDTAIYLFYGKAGATQPAAGATGGSLGVWDSDFMLVSHGDTATDSSGHTGVGGYDGSFAAGQVGNAYELNGTSEEFNLDAPDNGGSIPDATMEVWINPDAVSTGTNQAVLTSNDFAISGRFRLQLANSTPVMVLAVNGNTPGFFLTAFTISISTWTHLSYTYDQSTGALNQRKDWATSEDDTFTTAVNLDTGTPSATAGLIVGAAFDSGFFRWFGGLIDEVRMSKVVRSDAWREVSFDNQNDVSDVLQLETYVF